MKQMDLCNQKFIIDNNPNDSLLSKAFFHFSNISNRQCCVPWPFLNLHWYFDRVLSKNVVNCLQIILSKIFETKGKILIVQWYGLPEYLQMLHVYSGPYHVLMNSKNFEREVKSSTSSSREFQILGPNVLKLFSPNVVLFALLATSHFLFLQNVNLSWNNCAWSLNLRILKSYKLHLLISANGSLPWQAAPFLKVSCFNWSSYHYTITSKHVPVISTM